MLANVNLICVIAPLLIQPVPALTCNEHRSRSVLRGRTGAEYLLQSSSPGFQRFLQRNGNGSIFQCLFLCNLSYNCIIKAQLICLIRSDLSNDITESCCKQILRSFGFFQLHTHSITEGHLADRSGQTLSIQRIGRSDPSGFHILKKLAILLHYLSIFGKIVLIFFNFQQYQFISGLFQFRRNDILISIDIHRKGNQCRRHVDLIKRTGHTVLSADGGKAESHLGRICAQQCREGLTPSGGIFCHSAEVLLEGKADLPVIPAACHDAGNGFYHCVNGAMVGAPAG